jgi:hypothetical protein
LACWFAGLDPSSAQDSALTARNPTAVEACSTARALVDCTLDNMGVGRDLRQLRTLRFEIQSITFDLAQNNHTDAPFPVSGFATASVLEDYLGGREVTIRSAEGGGETRLFLSRQAQVTQSPNGALGKAIPPPPSWESQDPVRALLLARSATDLVREADIVSHDAPQHVVSFRKWSLSCAHFHRRAAWSANCDRGDNSIRQWRQWVGRMEWSRRHHRAGRVHGA